MKTLTTNQKQPKQKYVKQTITITSSGLYGGLVSKKLVSFFFWMSFDIVITNPKKFFKNSEKQNIPSRFSDFRGRGVDFA